MGKYFKWLRRKKYQDLNVLRTDKPVMQMGTEMEYGIPRWIMDALGLSKNERCCVQSITVKFSNEGVTKVGVDLYATAVTELANRVQGNWFMAKTVDSTRSGPIPPHDARALTIMKDHSNNQRQCQTIDNEPNHDD